jgi:outer membrane lipoprotein-sorting protein
MKTFTFRRMPIINGLLTLLLVSLVSATSLTAQSDVAPNGLSLMQQYQEAIRIQDLTSQIQYKNISRRGQVQERTLTQHIRRSAEGEDVYQLLLTFEAPVDVKGTRTLTWQHVDKPDDQWLYLPAVNATKRISASRQGDRFMGTEITFEDLSNYLSEDLEAYAYTLRPEAERNGTLCWVIEAVPTAAEEIKNSAYGRREIWLAKDSWVNVYTAFYDKKDVLIKTYEAWDIAPVDGSTMQRARRARMSNLVTGNKTEIEYDAMRINTNLSEAIFSRSNLESL